MRREEQNLRRIPAQGSAPLDLLARLGLSYRLGDTTTLRLAYRLQDRRDLLPAPSFSAREQTLALSLSYGAPRLAVTVTSEAGRTRDRLTGDRSPVRAVTVSGFYAPTPGQSHNAFAQYRRGGLFTGAGEREISFGLGSSIELGSRTALTLGIRRDQVGDTPSRTADYVELGLRRRLPHDQTLALVAFRRHGADQDDRAILVRYVIPFGLPVARKSTVGAVTGRTYDSETGQPLKGAVFRIGDAIAVSDASGRFVFAAEPTGAVYLMADTASLGADRVTLQPTPLKLEVRGGEITDLSVAVTRSVGVAGELRMYGEQASFAVPGEQDQLPGPGQPGTKGRALSGVVVQMQSGDQVERRLTDAWGRFEFEHLRPGPWTLAVPPGQLPKSHQLAEQSRTLDLEPGEQRRLILKVVPRVRRVRIIHEGGVLHEEPH